MVKPGRRSASGPDWKPERCHDCAAKHPAFNKDHGKAGTPWRCGPCDKVAVPLPRDDLIGLPSPTKASAQGSLL